MLSWLQRWILQYIFQNEKKIPEVERVILFGALKFEFSGLIADPVSSRSLRFGGLCFELFAILFGAVSSLSVSFSEWFDAFSAEMDYFNILKQCFKPEIVQWLSGSRLFYKMIPVSRYCVRVFLLFFLFPKARVFFAFLLVVPKTDWLFLCRVRTLKSVSVWRKVSILYGNSPRMGQIRGNAWVLLHLVS